MSQFVDRVSQYPVVESTCKVANDAYSWMKTIEALNPLLSKLESTAASLGAVLKPVVDSNITHKLDDVACQQVLNRIETIGTTLKESSADQLLGPVANRALVLAETCADFCLPQDQNVTPDSKELSRSERLMRIRDRASRQALLLFQASVSRAHELLAGLVDSTNQISQVLPTATVASTLTQVVSILNFACNTAKSVSTPIILQGLNLAKDQTEKLNVQLKESSKLNWIDLHNVISGLNTLRDLIDDQSKTGTALKSTSEPTATGSEESTQEVTQTGHS